jgi:predicted lysophospholipase L1 biosynthesis ABC-type transport system permease subunit
LSRKLIEYGSSSLPLDEWWAAVPEDRVDAFTAAVGAAHGTVTSRVGLRRELQEQPLRIGIQAALWLAVAAAGSLAAVGFATHTTVAIRVRRTEFSQLRAIGLTRRRLTSVVATENVLLCAIGAVCGVGIGVLLGLLVGPLVAMAADGGAPVPAVAVAIPWLRVGLLATELVALLAIVLLIVTRANRSQALGAVLRVGDER